MTVEHKPANYRAPHLSQFVALSVSPAVKDALASTNALVHRLRSVPDDVTSPELIDDRDRLMGQHLPGLLAAYRDANAAGSPSADTDLIEGLEHVREELGRILNVFQTVAGEALAIQRGFLESRYPGTDTGLFADPADTPPKPSDRVVNGSPEPIDVASVDALLPKAPPKAERQDAQEWKGAQKWKGSRFLSYDNIVAICFAIPVLIFFAMMFFGELSERRAEKAASEQIRSNLSTKVGISNLERRRDQDDQSFVDISLNIRANNKTRYNIGSMAFSVDYYVCPKNGATNSKSCTPLTSEKFDPLSWQTGVPAMTTTNVRYIGTTAIPDVEGRIGAIVRFISAERKPDDGSQ